MRRIYASEFMRQTGLVLSELFPKSANPSDAQIPSVWQGRYYSCPLDQTHIWEALRYTELNPFRARALALVKRRHSLRHQRARCILGSRCVTPPLDRYNLESTSEKGKRNPSWPPFVNEHTQGDRWELQNLFKILRRPRDGS